MRYRPIRCGSTAVESLRGFSRMSRVTPFGFDSFTSILQFGISVCGGCGHSRFTGYSPLISLAFGASSTGEFNYPSLGSSSLAVHHLTICGESFLDSRPKGGNHVAPATALMLKLERDI
jgi:hypothetical protein